MFVKKDDTSSSLLTPADKKTETSKQYISTLAWDLDYPSATNHKSCPLWMGDEQMMKCHFLWCISPYCPLLNSLPPAPAASPSSPFQSLLYHHISSGLSLPIFVVDELPSVALILSEQSGVSYFMTLVKEAMGRVKKRTMVDEPKSGEAA